MPREEKKRIATDGPQPPLAALEGAFAGLDTSALPDGPAAVPAQPASPQQIWKMGRVVLRRETAHRGGKCVIVVHDFATHLPASVIETIAKKIRQGCGCGGAVKGRTIEIQGDQPGRVRELLEKEGFQVAGVK
jgi:translation initiation factor 1